MCLPKPKRPSSCLAKFHSEVQAQGYNLVTNETPEEFRNTPGFDVGKWSCITGWWGPNRFQYHLWVMNLISSDLYIFFENPQSNYFKHFQTISSWLWISDYKQPNHKTIRYIVQNNSTTMLPISQKMHRIIRSPQRSHIPSQPALSSYFPHFPVSIDSPTKTQPAFQLNPPV